jgi:hypothetical protein
VELLLVAAVAGAAKLTGRPYSVLPQPPKPHDKPANLPGNVGQLSLAIRSVLAMPVMVMIVTIMIATSISDRDFPDLQSLIIQVLDDQALILFTLA